MRTVVALAAVATVAAMLCDNVLADDGPEFHPTEVEVCGVEAVKRRSGRPGSDEVDLKDTEHISVSNCPVGPCRLRRKTTTHVQFKFTPEKNVKTLRNEVNAKILGIPFPFLGVDNTNACGGILNADGSKASCPLTAGKEYIYKNKFDILEIYPKVKVDVHWALVNQDNERILCFTVPAKITS